MAWSEMALCEGLRLLAAVALVIGQGVGGECWLGKYPIGCKIYKTVLPAICCRLCVCQSSVMSPCSRFLTAVPWPISPHFVNA